MGSWLPSEDPNKQMARNINWALSNLADLKDQIQDAIGCQKGDKHLKYVNTNIADEEEAVNLMMYNYTYIMDQKLMPSSNMLASPRLVKNMMDSDSKICSRILKALRYADEMPSLS